MLNILLVAAQLVCPHGQTCRAPHTNEEADECRAIEQFEKATGIGQINPHHRIWLQADGNEVVDCGEPGNLLPQSDKEI